MSEPENNGNRLLEPEDYFKKSFDFAPHAMGILANDGTLLRVNQSLCRMFGYSEEELFQKNFSELSQAEDDQLDLFNRELCLSGEKKHYRIEKRHVHQNG
ncbi:MAG: PAS domain S-box protein, partial [Spirochaetia bacterium]|nr:PAS domain S-box protein [Spirochaetia bacterium]